MFSRSDFFQNIDEEQEDLSSSIDLIHFLMLYLNSETTKSIEDWAKLCILNPEEDTDDFINFIKGEVSEKLWKDRHELKKITEKLISDYRNDMEISENQNPSTGSCSIDSFDSDRVNAGMKLTQGLEAMIPEPKRSEFKHKALHVIKGRLEDYINDLREDLLDYIDNRELEIQHRLTALLDNFENDLITLSRQLRVVSKIDLLVEELKKERISEEEKDYIFKIVEPVKNSLKKGKLTPAMEGNVFELARRAKKLARLKTSRSFKSTVKELAATIDYLAGKYD